MLDALVNEAQIRWGLDLSQGLQVVPAEWLAAIPGRAEPSADPGAARRRRPAQVRADVAAASHVADKDPAGE